MFKDCLKSSIKSFGSSKPICNLTRCSSLAKFKYFLFPCSLDLDIMQDFQSHPSYNHIQIILSEFTNLITEFLFFDFIFNPINPDAPE